MSIMLFRHQLAIVMPSTPSTGIVSRHWEQPFHIFGWIYVGLVNIYHLVPLRIAVRKNQESDNNCQGTCNFASKRPDLIEGPSSIKNQLDKYIEKEFPTCINNFIDLQQQGFEINALSNIKADTKITENDVVEF